MVHNLFLLCLCGIFAYFSAGTEAIIGGNRVVLGAFSYQVSLQRHGIHFCGGGIINDELVVTVAHCLLTDDNEFQETPITVVAGTTNLQRTQQPAVTVPVKTIYVPKHFGNRSVGDTYDIAILKLNHTLNLSQNAFLERLKLSKSKDVTYNGVKAHIAGFGWTHVDYDGVQESNGYGDGYLWHAKADVLEPSHLHYRLATNFKREICARIPPYNDGRKRGVCQGDGGGVLVYQGTAIGILSRSPLGCSEADYGASYIRLTEYRTFFRNIIANQLTRNIRVKELIR